MKIQAVKTIGGGMKKLAAFGNSKSVVAIAAAVVLLIPVQQALLGHTKRLRRKHTNG